MTVQTITPDDGPSTALALPTAVAGELPGLAVLDQWVEAASRAEQLVARIVDTPFVPASLWPLPPGRRLQDFPAQNPRVPDRGEDPQAFQYRRQVAIASGTSAVLRGMGLGLDPLVALDQIFVIYGRPSMYVRLKVALVQARGHEVDTVERTDDKAVVRGRRKGETDWQPPVTITIGDACRAGWVKNDAYEKTPADMLWNRAASRVVDMIGADVLFGIASLEDVDPVEDTEGTPVPVRVTLADVKGETAPPAAVEAPPAPAVAEADQGAPARPDNAIDERTWRMVNARFVDLGVTGPGQNERRLAVLGYLVGRPVDKGRELTAVEGGLVLDRLRTIDRAGLAAVEQAIRGLEGTGTPVEQAAAPEPTAAAAEAWPDDVDPDDAALEPTDDELAAHAAHAEQGGPEPAGWDR